MNAEQRALLAMAVAIRAEFAQRRPANDEAGKLPIAYWDDLVTTARQIKRARQHGFHLAAASLIKTQLTEATRFQYQFNAWLDRRRDLSSLRPSRNAENLFRDLIGLKQEFGDVTYDRDETELSVTTEPIELEGVHLGPFAIRLNCQLVGITKPYRVVALDANPAASKGDITHPHVQDEYLCEGGGQQAIQRALSDWRLYDFFLIVRQILSTYSEGRAYVELADWHGKACTGCGCTLTDDESFGCQGCNSTLCSECTYICRGCGYDFCTTCISNCAHCDSYFCGSCLSVCEICKTAVCSGCQENENLCTRCHEREQAAAEQAVVVPVPTRRPRRVRAAV